VGVPTAVVYHEHGGPEVLTLAEVGVPVPGPGQVLVAVRAAGVNPVDWKDRAGGLDGVPMTRPRGLGVDLAGVVEATGPGVTAFGPGDDVFGRASDGAYAEYALCAVDDLVAKPATLPWDVAASLAVTTETAVRTLRLLGITGQAAEGRGVLVHGASGGVGAMATQLACLRGARVIGTAGPRNHDLVRSFGAHPVQYGDGWADRVRAVAPHGVDAVLDAPGRGVLRESIALAGHPDRVVTIADRGAEHMGVRYSRGKVARLGMAEVFDEVLPHIVSGRLRVVIGARYPLTDVVAAHRLSQGGHPGGRIVLLVGRCCPARRR
jgi:NADPH:quinone reductase-like Zn-dependent oxidoreductase